VTATADARPQIVLIVAIAENGVIGAGGAIPWRLKSDMQRFKALTLDKPVVMGRKTFVSIGRPLPKRTNIVVTRDADFRAAGAVVTNSLADARAVATGDALRRFATEIAVIGARKFTRSGSTAPTAWKSPRCTRDPTATPVSPLTPRRGKRCRGCEIRPDRTTAPISPM